MNLYKGIFYPSTLVFLLFLCLGVISMGGCTAPRRPISPVEEMQAEAARRPVHSNEPDFLELLREAMRNYENINDYTTNFTKRQRVRGRLLPDEEIFMKFRKPHAVYMKWRGKVDRGQEVLYVKGRYDDKLLAHKGGLILSRITAALDPNGKRALKKNLRPVTCAGIGFLIHSLYDVSSRAKENGDMRIEYLGPVDLPDGMAHKFERLLEEGKGYPCRRAVICLDGETGFPVLYEAYDSADNLLERYGYNDMKTDTGLVDDDFDKDNKEYRFGLF